MSHPEANELVTGPISGYYVATYACPAGTAREQYAPYFKLFTTRPESYFQQEDCLLKSRPPTLTNDARRALEIAQMAAEELIARLPPPGELRATRIKMLLDALRRQEGDTIPSPLIFEDTPDVAPPPPKR